MQYQQPVSSLVCSFCLGSQILISKLISTTAQNCTYHKVTSPRFTKHIISYSAIRSNRLKNLL